MSRWDARRIAVAGGHRSDLSGGGMAHPGHTGWVQALTFCFSTSGSGLCFTQIHGPLLTVSFPLWLFCRPPRQPLHPSPFTAAFSKTWFQGLKRLPSHSFANVTLIYWSTWLPQISSQATQAFIKRSACFRICSPWCPTASESGQILPGEWLDPEAMLGRNIPGLPVGTVQGPMAGDGGARQCLHQEPGSNFTPGCPDTRFPDGPVLFS